MVWFFPDTVGFLIKMGNVYVTRSCFHY